MLRTTCKTTETSSKTQPQPPAFQTRPFGLQATCRGAAELGTGKGSAEQYVFQTPFCSFSTSVFARQQRLTEYSENNIRTPTIFKMFQEWEDHWYLGDSKSFYPRSGELGGGGGGFCPRSSLPAFESCHSRSTPRSDHTPGEPQSKRKTHRTGKAFQTGGLSRMIQRCKRSGREAEAAGAEALYELTCLQTSSELVTGEHFNSSPTNSLPKKRCPRGLSMLSPCPAHGMCLHLIVLHLSAIHSFHVVDLSFSL